MKTTPAHHRYGSEPRSFSLRLHLPPLPRSARAGRDALAAVAHVHDVSEDDVESLTFALGEALANAIEHAQSDAEIEVAVTIDATAIVVTVCDRGRGIPASPSAMLPFPGSGAEGGRGFPIMQRCTDFFDVATRPGGGTLVTLGRHRRRAGAAAS